MVPDAPGEPDHPAAWWQIILLFTAVGVVALLAVYGAIELCIRATAWLPTE